ncbi:MULTISPECIES: MCE family protein [unclassified Mycobacterium]|uniref:MCE family protein n=1 Tax=unclassified Mycobacterium TaxID=2642494 RepID=UPI0029C99465|nr:MULTISPECIES: MCE family protein [unclassified Mycobacterium]
MNAKLVRVLTAVALVGLLFGAAAFVVNRTLLAPRTITAYFVSATGIYQGDEVRVAGVKVGSIGSIEPAGGQAKMVIHVDHDVPVPADAKAVIVAQSLVAARYVQLTPAYETSGPTMADGAVIGVDRTAIPVEWDEVKAQLTRLATDLGPRSGVSGTSISRFIDSAAGALDGNGEKLRQTIAQLAGLGRTLADGSGNIVDVITNLQTFVTALRDSNQQIVQFQDRFATLTSVVNDQSNLGTALTDLSSAIGDVRRFVAGSRDQTAEQFQRLANVTQNLVDHKLDLENLLHAAPNAVANGYDIYDPDSGAQVGRFALNNFSNPSALLCNAITAVANVTAGETGKLCAQTLGPALNTISINELPFSLNPYLEKSFSPDRIIYSDPSLAPGGTGPKPVPPDIPPAVSAYTGLNGDQPAPPGFGQPPAVAPGSSAPDHLPADPSPALFPGAPVPGPPSVPSMLLPAEAGPPPSAGTP